MMDGPDERVLPPSPLFFLPKFLNNMLYLPEFRGVQRPPVYPRLIVQMRTSASSSASYVSDNRTDGNPLPNGNLNLAEVSIACGHSIVMGDFHHPPVGSFPAGSNDPAICSCKHCRARGTSEVNPRMHGEAASKWISANAEAAGDALGFLQRSGKRKLRGLEFEFFVGRMRVEDLFHASRDFNAVVVIPGRSNEWPADVLGPMLRFRSNALAIKTECAEQPVRLVDLPFGCNDRFIE